MGRIEDSGIYRDLMRFKPEELTPNAWAVTAGVSRTVWTDMRRHGNPSRRTLEKLLAAAGSSLAEFEALRVGNDAGGIKPAAGSGVAETQRRGWGGQAIPPLPLVQSNAGGEWRRDTGIELIETTLQRRLDLLPRPPSLAGDPDAFALTIVGKSMWPRFRAGKRVAVSPRAVVAIGDDVLVRLKSAKRSGPERALLGELVRRTHDHVELRQFNPDTTFSVDAAEIEAIHKVAGELI